MKLFWSHILALVLGASGMFVYETTIPADVITNTDTVTTIDTVTIVKPPIKITEYVTKLDTVTFYSQVNDTIYLTETAHIDTSFDEGDLSIDYYYVPRAFDILWQPKPTMTTQETTIVKPTTIMPDKTAWYSTPLVSFMSGVIATTLIVGVTK